MAATCMAAPRAAVRSSPSNSTSTPTCGGRSAARLCMYVATCRPSAPSTTTAISSIFSPMTAATESMFSATVRPSASVSASSAWTSPVPVLAAWVTMSAASCWNCSFLATKSVSQLSWIIAPSAAATRPLVALRSAPRSLTLVSPLILRVSTALSKSPPVSSRAFFAAIIPAPVASRSFLTSAAVMFAISRSLRCRGGRPWWATVPWGYGGATARSGLGRLGSVSRGRLGGVSRGRLGGVSRRRLGRRGPGHLGHLGHSGVGGGARRGGGLGAGALDDLTGGRRALGGLAAQQLPLPLGQRLVGGEALGLVVALLRGAHAGHQAVGDRVGDHPGEQRDRSDRVVVAGNLVVDLVRVAGGDEDGDHRDAQLVRLADGDVLLRGVDDPHRARDAGHVPDAAEGLRELVLLAAQDQQLLLGHARAGHVVEVELLELLEALQPPVDGLEVGEHAAQPALVHVRHPDPGRLLGDRLLGLLLGADEHHRAAVRDGLLDELVRAVDVGQRLLQVDDVDAVALGEDEALHLRVPTAGLVPEVHAALEQLLHGHDLVGGHGPACLSCAPAAPSCDGGGRAPLGSSRSAGRPPRPDACGSARHRRGPEAGREDRGRAPVGDRECPAGDGVRACEVDPQDGSLPASVRPARTCPEIHSGGETSRSSTDAARATGRPVRAARLARCRSIVPPWSC